MAEWDINEMHGQQWEPVLTPIDVAAQRQKQLEEMVELYKAGIITGEMMKEVVSMAKDPPLKVDEPIKSRFDILDL